MGSITIPGIYGYVELADQFHVIGWAFAPASQEHLQLRLFVDDQDIIAVDCTENRPDVDEQFGRLKVGFDVSIPRMFFDGKAHQISLRNETGELITFQGADGLENSTWIFKEAEEQVVGQLDDWGGRDVHCWAVLINRKTGSAVPAPFVSVQQMGTEVVRLTPTITRPDVSKVFDCTPICGFILPAAVIRRLPTKEPLHFMACSHEIELAGSPLSLKELQPASRERDQKIRSDTALFGNHSQTSASSDEAFIIEFLRQSNLFDSVYYLETYPDLADADIPLFDHYVHFGYLEGRKPNAYFEPQWYLEHLQDNEDDTRHPLIHFLIVGEKAGYNPGPLFNVSWYREHYSLDAQENSLDHYLARRLDGAVSPVPEFDAIFYSRQNPDVIAARVDPFIHFFNYGYRECRNPSADFDVKFYVQRYLGGSFDVNPLTHFWSHRGEPGVYGRPPDDEVTVSREIKRFSRKGTYFEEARTTPPINNSNVLLLAYYLPQFHPFKENDEWWGRGFTEWTNLVRGSPRFVGHYQPRIPRDLGFYSLATTEIMKEQIHLARLAGIAAFVFYYYWFNGKKLMDQPVQRFLSDKTLDIQFALMWANENWTRRWDGAESEVLISQDYRESDDIEMAADFALHFRDPRYIRLGDRPILMIYRAGIIPNVEVAIARWRNVFRTMHDEDPIFIMAQAFNAENPTEYGFDGAIEFPPHKLTTHLIPSNSQFEYLDTDFTGTIHKFDDIAQISMDEDAVDFPLIKTAIPSWDNDARRQGTGMAITGSTPLKYQEWLTTLIKRAKANPFFGRPIVCINAWNEWCEGAYLEPDLHFGAAYLNATARALINDSIQEPAPCLILVGHDGFPGGAQHLLLNIGRILTTVLGVRIEFLLLNGGDLVREYQKIANVTIVASDDQLSGKLKALRHSGFTASIVNTTAAGRAVAFLDAEKVRSVLLVHELPRIIEEKHLIDHARLGLGLANKVLFSAPYVRDAVLRFLNLETDSRVSILPQGSYKEVLFDGPSATCVRAEFSIDSRDKVVLGAGYADLRKGFDLFLALSKNNVLMTDGNYQTKVHFIWVGGLDPGLGKWLAEEISIAESSKTFHMAGYRSDVAAFFSAADVFVLTSREDPLPTVVMEALGAGVPVVAFDNTGGVPDMLKNIGQGIVVPYGDISEMGKAIRTLLRAGITSEDRALRNQLIRNIFNFEDYTCELLKYAHPQLSMVTVAVPNYNYEQYISLRMISIFEQTYPVREILVLDDCSSDASIEAVRLSAASAHRIVKEHNNAVNSGSVFVQWRRAAELARGEFIWIAEADDISDPSFLATCIALLQQDANIQFAFTDSMAINSEGAVIFSDYKGYYETVEPGALSQTVILDADVFVRRYLAVKNLILNVSSVVWRLDALLGALERCSGELKEFRMAGDWLLYLTSLSSPGARVAYDARPLNVHRRHSTSVTHSLAAARHVAEIGRCQQFAALAFELDGNTKDAQSRYLAEVERQLTTGGTDNLEAVSS